MKNFKWNGVFSVKCTGQDGTVKWEESAHNALFNEGEYAILDIAMRGGTAPSNWYIGLMKNTLTSIPAESSNLASLSSYELSPGQNSGYSSRAQINRDATADGWPTLILTSGDYQLTSKTVTFNASGNWTDTVRWFFLTTNGTAGDTTGLLISLAQLSADRTLVSGDSLAISYNIKLT